MKFQRTQLLLGLNIHSILISLSLDLLILGAITVDERVLTSHCISGRSAGTLSFPLHAALVVVAKVDFWLIDYQAESQDQTSKNATIYMLPFPPMYKLFDERLKEISPSFVEVYNQAALSEALGLDKITGMGYRKALEYLIKDWVSREKPEAAEKVKEMLLGQCIKNFVDDERVKKCAERAVWLGNDETHYVRKWEDKDISDLKTLL